MILLQFSLFWFLGRISALHYTALDYTDSWKRNLKRPDIILTNTALEDTVVEEKNENKSYCPAQRMSSQSSSTSEGKII